MENRISGHTRLLALLGSPVDHSGSPAMYNYSFDRLGIDYAYVAFDVKEDQMPQAIEAMKLFNMRGCNVTMPCKTAAVALMDELSPAAALIGAVNTIVNEDGRLIGHSTDGIGFVQNLKEHGVDVKGKKLTQAEEQKVKLAAKNLYNKLTIDKDELLVVDWYKDDQPKFKVKSAIESALDKDLPESYDKEAFEAKTNLLLNHFIDMAIQGYGWIAA